MARIKLIVGLGNPGAEYAETRHNVGAWFVESLAKRHQSPLKSETKFHGQVAKFSLTGNSVFLLIPNTYMNESGRAVQALAQFYKIAPAEILVAHDELDFPAGQIRLKENGGHGGHNGLRDILQKLGSDQFVRLRIGIGHPGHKDKVSPYVLSRPSASDDNRIRAALDAADTSLEDIVAGDLAKAMRYLHQ